MTNFVPITETPYAENPNTEKPYTENPSQLNTNSLNTDLNKNIKELTTKETEDFQAILDEAVFDKELTELYWDYINMRLSTKAPLTNRGLKMLINRCERLAEFNLDIQKNLLETAIINGWKNVYAPREEEAGDRENARARELKRFYNS